METSEYKRLFRIINSYIFDNVYNGVFAEFRSNIRMTILNGGKHSKSLLNTKFMVSMMPTQYDEYYTYVCSKQSIGGIMNYQKDWIDFETLYNTNQISLDVISADGMMIPKRFIYIKTIGWNKMAVTVNRIFLRNNNIDQNTLSMVVNVDSDVPNITNLISHIPDIVDNYATIVNAVAAYPNPEKLRLFVNGYERAVDVFMVGLSSNDTIEMYEDQNIEFVVEMSLEVRHSYFSTTEALNKDILHIPKAVADGKLKTYDTVELFIRDADGTGVMLPFNHQYSVSQLTNADFGITSLLIDASLDFLGVDTGTIHFVCKNYSRNETIVPNSYQCERFTQFETDVSIVAHIEGTIDGDLTVWSGDRLETNKYNEFMFNPLDGQDFSVVLIADHISCLGYHNFMKVIDSEVYQRDTSPTVTQLTILKPHALKYEDLHPIFYSDGLKYDENDIFSIEQISSGDDEYVRITVDEVTPELLTLPQVKFIDDPDFFSYVTTPVASGEVFVVPNTDDIRIYVKGSGASIKTMTETLNSGYTEVDLGATSLLTMDTDDVNHDVIFNIGAVGLEFLIFYKNHTWKRRYEPDITGGDNIVITPVTTTINTAAEVLILTEETYEIYLNGRFLAPNVDYTIKKLTDTNNADMFAGYSLVIQNLKFLEPVAQNVIEVYATGCVVNQIDTNFVIDNTIFGNVDNELLIQGLTRVFVDGEIINHTDITREKNQLSLTPGIVENGEVAVIMTDINMRISNAYSQYEDGDYETDRSAIANYFLDGYEPVTPSPLVVPATHTLYSSYINEIIRRVINGTIAVVYTDSDEGITSQLVAYDYLKAFDVLFSNDSKVDSRFVDFYPGYLTTTSVDDFEKYRFIKRFVSIMLRSDLVHDGNIVFDQP